MSLEMHDNATGVNVANDNHGVQSGVDVSSG